MYMYKCINSAESSNRFVKCLNSPILKTDNTRTCSVSRLDRRHDYFSMLIEHAHQETVFSKI